MFGYILVFMLLIYFGAGVSLASLTRAKARLEIKSRKAGMTGGWVWELPEDAQPKAEDAQC